MFDESKIEVKMNGKEYIEYLDATRINLDGLKKITRNKGMMIVIGSLLGLLLIPLIHSVFNPPKSVVWGTSNIYGLMISNGLIVWLAVAMGIAWMLHGFGFIIVKR